MSINTDCTGLRTVWQKNQQDKCPEETKSFMSFKEGFSDTIEKMNERTDFSRNHDMVKLTRKECDFSC